MKANNFQGKTEIAYNFDKFHGSNYPSSIPGPMTGSCAHVSRAARPHLKGARVDNKDAASKYQGSVLRFLIATSDHKGIDTRCDTETLLHSLHHYKPFLFRLKCLSEVLKDQCHPGWYSSVDSAWAVNQRAAGSIPSQGTCLGCSPGPQWGPRERQPHTDVSFPLFLHPFPSL